MFSSNHSEGKIVKITENTYITNKGKVIRKNHISSKPIKVRSILSGLEHRKRGSPLTPAANVQNVASSSSSQGNAKKKPMFILPRDGLSSVSASSQVAEAGPPAKTS